MTVFPELEAGRAAADPKENGACPEFCIAGFPYRAGALKWSDKFGQDAKLVPIGKETYDGTLEIHGDFKGRVVVEAMRRDQTVRAIAARHGINPHRLTGIFGFPAGAQYLQRERK